MRYKRLFYRNNDKVLKSTIYQPLLVKEALASLNILPKGINIDGTLGQVGHTSQTIKTLVKLGEY
jgi:16S rRNA C1402 N4-methylase RsmH